MAAWSWSQSLRAQLKPRSKPAITPKPVAAALPQAHIASLPFRCSAEEARELLVRYRQQKESWVNQVAPAAPASSLHVRPVYLPYWIAAPFGGERTWTVTARLHLSPVGSNLVSDLSQRLLSKVERPGAPGEARRTDVFTEPFQFTVALSPRLVQSACGRHLDVPWKIAVPLENLLGEVGGSAREAPVVPNTNTPVVPNANAERLPFSLLPYHTPFTTMARSSAGPEEETYSRQALEQEPTQVEWKRFLCPGGETKDLERWADLRAREMLQFAVDKQLQGYELKAMHVTLQADPKPSPRAGSVPVAPLYYPMYLVSAAPPETQPDASKETSSFDYYVDGYTGECGPAQPAPLSPLRTAFLSTCFGQGIGMSLWTAMLHAEGQPASQILHVFRELIAQQSLAGLSWWYPVLTVSSSLLPYLMARALNKTYAQHMKDERTRRSALKAFAGNSVAFLRDLLQRSVPRGQERESREFAELCKQVPRFVGGKAKAKEE